MLACVFLEESRKPSRKRANTARTLYCCAVDVSSIAEWSCGNLKTDTVKLRAYPRTEQKLTLCVEEVDTDVLCSSHGGEHAMQLVRSVCADAGENVAAVGAAVAQVSV